MEAGTDNGLRMADIEVLYQRSNHSVLYRCQQLLRDEEAAYDAMHQTFVRAIRYRSSYQGHGPVAWLLSIAVRVCLDELRRMKKEPVQIDIEAEDLAATLADRRDVSFDRRLDQQRIVAKLLPRSSKRVQEIVIMRFFDELEVQQIAHKTSLSERTVARRLSQFIKGAERWAK